MSHSSLPSIENGAVSIDSMQTNTMDDAMLRGNGLIGSPDEISSNSSLPPLFYWKEISICAGFFLISLLPRFLGTNERPIPFQQISSGDYILNLNINEIVSQETVPNLLLFFLALLIPLSSQLTVSLMTRSTHLLDVHATLCAYLVAVALTELGTESVKQYVGYLRPNFYQTCQPSQTMDACLGMANDARKSFPSGHSSMSFTGLSLISLFLQRRFGVESIRDRVPRSQRLKYRIQSVLALAPIALAIFIAASRVHDNVRTVVVCVVYRNLTQIRNTIQRMLLPGLY